MLTHAAHVKADKHTVSSASFFFFFCFFVFVLGRLKRRHPPNSLRCKEYLSGLIRTKSGVEAISAELNSGVGGHTTALLSERFRVPAGRDLLQRLSFAGGQV